MDGWMEASKQASSQARDNTATSCPAPFRGRSSSAKFSEVTDPALLCVFGVFVCVWNLCVDLERQFIETANFDPMVNDNQTCGSAKAHTHTHTLTHTHTHT